MYKILYTEKKGLLDDNNNNNRIDLFHFNCKMHDSYIILYIILYIHFTPNF